MKYLIHLVLLIISPLCFSLGLGEATLHSSLNEPLLVRIPVIASEENANSEMRVKIASPEVFAKQNVERTFVHSLLKTRLVQNGNNEQVIEIYTRKPFKDAWIDFLLDVRWPKGNIVKEVNLLIDLPDSV